MEPCLPSKYITSLVKYVNQLSITSPGIFTEEDINPFSNLETALKL